MKNRSDHIAWEHLNLLHSDIECAWGMMPPLNFTVSGIGQIIYNAELSNRSNVMGWIL